MASGPCANDRSFRRHDFGLVDASTAILSQTVSASLATLQIVMEVRTVSNKNTQAVTEAMEAVRRRVISEFGLTPSRVVSAFCRMWPKAIASKSSFGCLEGNGTVTYIAQGGRAVERFLVSRNHSRDRSNIAIGRRRVLSIAMFACAQAWPCSVCRHSETDVHPDSIAPCTP